MGGANGRRHSSGVFSMILTEQEFDGLGLSFKKLRRRLSPKRAFRTMRGDEVVRRTHKLTHANRPTKRLPRMTSQARAVHKDVHGRYRPTKAYRTARPGQLVDRIRNTNQARRAARRAASMTKEMQKRQARAALQVARTPAPQRAAAARQAQQAFDPSKFGYNPGQPWFEKVRSAGDKWRAGSLDYPSEPSSLPAGQLNPGQMPGDYVVPGMTRPFVVSTSNVLPFPGQTKAQRRFLEWVSNWNPELYQAAIDAAGEPVSLSATDDWRFYNNPPASSGDTSSGGGWFDSITNAIGSLANVYLQTEHQKNVLKINRQRAAQGLDPIAPEQARPGVNVTHSVDQGILQKLAMPAALAVGGLLLAKKLL